MEQKAKEAASHAAIPVSISAMLVTLGVVYGDIGTSPLYALAKILKVMERNRCLAMARRRLRPAPDSV